MNSSVLLLGATGLVGSDCLQLLLHNENIKRVIAVTRRPLLITHNKLTTHVIDFENLDTISPLFAVDAVICALGTTIKQAGSQEAFRRVDHDYPIAGAEIALKQNVQHFLLVSALGADRLSKIFYNKVKGEVEHKVSAMPFRSITIVRPSLLLGDRKKFRLGEQIGKVFTPIIPLKYKPIQAKQVAQQLVNSVIKNNEGIHRIENQEMFRSV